MRAYLRNDIESASPSRILEMLLMGAMRFMDEAERDYQEQRPLQARQTVSRAADIVTELSATLRTDLAPDLAAALLPIYDFVIRRLLHSVLHDDPVALSEAKKTFEVIAEAFLQALEKAQVDHQAAQAAQAAAE